MSTDLYAFVREKENKYEKYSKRIKMMIRTGTITQGQGVDILKKEANKLGLKVAGINIPARTCKSPWEIPYDVPTDSKFKTRDGDCGKGCFCVDEEIPTESLDKINRAKFINRIQTCSGGHNEKYPDNEFSQMHSPMPFFSFTFTKPQPLNKKVLNELCDMANIQLDDPRNTKFIDVCGRDKYKFSSKEVKNYRRSIKDNSGLYKKFSTISIEGRTRNTTEFWKRINDTLYKL